VCEGKLGIKRDRLRVELVGCNDVGVTFSVSGFAFARPQVK
jgi:hypothetical protein